MEMEYTQLTKLLEHQDLAQFRLREITPTSKMRKSNQYETWRKKKKMPQHSIIQSPNQVSNPDTPIWVHHKVTTRSSIFLSYDSKKKNVFLKDPEKESEQIKRKNKFLQQKWVLKEGKLTQR